MLDPLLGNTEMRVVVLATFVQTVAWLGLLFSGRVFAFTFAPAPGRCFAPGRSHPT
jgi:hypothetical protein